MKTHLQIFAYLLILSLFFIKGNCQVPELIYQKKIFISDTLLIKASNFIILKTDKNFYNKFISLNEKISTNSMLVYNFKVNETNKLIVLFITNNGEIDKENSIIDYKQLKNCLSSKTCNLLLDINSAIEIVKKEGLKKGTGGWKVSFIPWAGKKNDLRWSIQNSYGSSGESLTINAITGEVEHSSWERNK